MTYSRRKFISSTAIACALPILTPNFAFADATNNEFVRIANFWQNGWLMRSPSWATQIGDHRFDNEIDNLSALGRTNILNFAHAVLNELELLDKTKLSRDNMVDYALLDNFLRGQIWNIENLKEYSWNPLIYQSAAGDAIYGLMAREFAPLKTRLLNAISRIEKIPTIFAAAKAELEIAKIPTPQAVTYSNQNKGLKALIEEMIAPHLGLLNARQKRRANLAISNFNGAVDNHQKWIDEVLVPAAIADFRMGSENFDAKLKFTLLSNLSRQEIRARAEQNIIDVRKRMYQLSRQVFMSQNANENLPINPDFEVEQNTIKRALDMAASIRPPQDRMVETATAQVEKARQFVLQKNLIKLPDGPVRVIEMPEFQRGYAVAYCDSPGPLDKNLPTFYAVSPIPENWTQEQITSYLREYNMRGLEDISVHEAMPGHYVQIFHSNSCPSVLRALLSSGSFVEGWAVYAEKLMVEEGYNGDDPLYELTQLKVLLRTTTNSIIDQAIHCDGMTQEQMMELLTKKAFQEEREAAGKWRRAQLGFTQLSTYFVGFMEHIEAREAAKAKWGPSFNIRRYNDGILAYGSPPVKFARALLLDEQIPN